MRTTTNRRLIRRGIALVALVCAAGAAPARELALSDAPGPVQQAVRAAPSVIGNKVDALEVEERDLNHDGQKEWLVVADLTDEAGLHAVNRPLWLFLQEGRGAGGTWRLVDYLGEQIKVEARKGTGAWDDLVLITKDGPHQRCAVLGWDREHYRKKGCCDPRSGAAATCPTD